MGDIKTPYDTKEVKDRIKKLDLLLKTNVSLYNHLTRNGYIEYILNGDISEGMSGVSFRVGHSYKNNNGGT